MLRIAVVIAALGLSSAAHANACNNLLDSFNRDHAASVERAARVGMRRLDLFSMSSRASDTEALADIAKRASEDMAEILLTAELERRAAYAQLSRVCSD